MNKYCLYHKFEVYCDDDCINCRLLGTYHESQFNYECPDCHGKFNYVSYKYLERTCQSKPCCPFCGKIMEGFNG